MNKSFKIHKTNWHQFQLNNNDTESLESMQNTEQNTWQLKLVINYTDALYYSGNDSSDSDLTNRVIDSEVIMAVHSPKVIPNFLEAEFTPILQCTYVNVHYTKQIITLKTSPYFPSCKEFPVDRSECKQKFDKSWSISILFAYIHYSSKNVKWMSELLSDKSSKTEQD